MLMPTSGDPGFSEAASRRRQYYTRGRHRSTTNRLHGPYDLVRLGPRQPAIEG
jgi:hypothetical protein